MLLLRRLPVRLRLGDAGLLLHLGGVRGRQVLDVAGGVVDLLDLQGVDDEAKLLHLLAGVAPRGLGEGLPLPDHLLHGEAADDGAEMALEDVLDLLFELDLRLVEEAPGGVGDRGEVVADLVDDDRLDADRDALGRHAGDVELGLVGIEGEVADALDTGHDEGTLAGDDLEAEALGDALDGVLVEARDDERLVGLGDPPHRTEQQEDQHQRHDHNATDDGQRTHGSTSFSRLLAAQAGAT